MEAFEHLWRILLKVELNFYMASFTVNSKNVINETISFYGTAVVEEKGRRMRFIA